MSSTRLLLASSRSRIFGAQSRISSKSRRHLSSSLALSQPMAFSHRNTFSKVAGSSIRFPRSSSITYNAPNRMNLDEQKRFYLYLPTSWQEFEERFRRWMENTEQRMVNVQVLKRQSLPSLQLPIPKARREYKGWKARRRKDYQGWKARRKAEYQVWKVRQKENYQGWKSRRTAEYQSWKLHRKEQYQGWKKIGKARYEGWKLKKRRQIQKNLPLVLRTKRLQIELDEYSKPEWFDRLGRPLTARDSTGRFVNPWRSQSTNGVQSLHTIVSWRLQRIHHNLRKYGLIGSLTPRVSWNSGMSLASASSPPLPKPVPSQTLTTWIGHSTCYLQTQNKISILIDPMFSLRASPYQWFPIGVPREIPPSHSISELVSHGENGKIDFCCITHDHYDHMDHDSCIELRDCVQKWIVPIGLADWLVEECGIDRKRIIELEWWQQAHFSKSDIDGGIQQLDRLTWKDDGYKEKGKHSLPVVNRREKEVGRKRSHSKDNTVTFTCSPASHWASRTMFDRNTRLWCSYAINAYSSGNIFTCGDTGYPENFPLFRQIGDVLGPFDLALLPIGAYEPIAMNKEAHVHPREAVQIHNDIKARKSVAVHWGTFPLSEESMDDPPKQLEIALSTKTVAKKTSDLPSRHGLMPFTTVGHGESIATFPETAQPIQPTNVSGKS